MSRSPLTNYEILDASGDPVSGGKLYTYESGTTNLLATYSDAAKSVANANPLVTGADGIIANPIYMQDNVAYTFVEKDASDNTLRSEDGIYSSALSSNTNLTNPLAFTPVQYGGTGDGASDETTEVQAAIDAAEAQGSGGTVDLLGLTWRCDSTLTITDTLTLQNGVLDFSSNSDSIAIQVHGSLGSVVALDADASAGDVTVQLASSTGKTAGTLFSLYSSNTSIPSGSSKVEGEIFETEAFSGVDPQPKHPLFNAYTTANSAAVRDIVTVDDVRFKNLVIHAGPAETISLVNTRRAAVENVTIYGVAAATHVMVAGCYQTSILNCVFSGKSASTNEVGVQIDEASQYTNILNCAMHGIDCAVYSSDSATLTKSTAANGNPRFITVENLQFTNTVNPASPFSPIVITAWADYVSLVGCKFNVSTTTGSADTIQIDAQHTEVRNCVIHREGTSTGDALGFSPETFANTIDKPYIRITGNSIFADRDNVVDIDLTGAYGLVDFSNNWIEGDVAINALTSATVELITVNDCYTEDLYFAGQGDQVDLDRIVIRGCRVDGRLTLLDAEDSDVSGTRVLNEVYCRFNGSAGCKLALSHVTVDGSSVALDSSVYIQSIGSATGTVIISNCLIAGTGSKAGVILSESTSGSFTGLELTGNYFNHSSTSNVVNISAPLSRGAITGNSFISDNTTNPLLRFSSSATNQINHVFVAGNNFEKGTYAISILDEDESVGIEIGVNKYNGQSTDILQRIDERTKYYPIPLGMLRSITSGLYNFMNTADVLNSGRHYSVWATGTTGNLHLLGNSPSSNTQTDVSVFDYVLPVEYMPQGSITIGVWAQYTADGDTKTLDVTCGAVNPADGTGGSDLVTTTAKTLTGTSTLYEFTVTPTGLSQGDILRVVITTVFEDSDGAVGEARINGVRVTHATSSDIYLT